MWHCVGLLTCSLLCDCSWLAVKEFTHRNALWVEDGSCGLPSSSLESLLCLPQVLSDLLCRHLFVLSSFSPLGQGSVVDCVSGMHSLGFHPSTAKEKQTASFEQRLPGLLLFYTFFLCESATQCMCMRAFVGGGVGGWVAVWLCVCESVWLCMHARAHGWWWWWLLF